MLNIYYGRESIDKEKFIYEKIREDGGRTIVLVPDQYTLEAEKQAFAFMGKKGLLDVEIISMSRLGSKLLSEQGGGKNTFIDKYGRHMLLGDIISQLGDELKAFTNTGSKRNFIEMTNNFISEMKQYNVGPSDLEKLVGEADSDKIFADKMKDLSLIFTEYEKRIEGKYTDSEDLISLYSGKIKTSEFMKESVFWIYGFDSFAPRALDVIENIIGTAPEVNVFLTYDRGSRDEELFDLTGLVMHNLKSRAEACGSECRISKAPACYTITEKSGSVKCLERELFSVAKRSCEDCEGLVLLKAANPYSEAEAAAAFVLHLLRDKGYRKRDIAIICNDQDVRGPIIRRVFDEFGLEIFDDRKRSVLSSPLTIFIVALIDIVANRYRTSDIFRLLKTGLCDISVFETEMLENYTIKYRIRGNMWKKPFVKGNLEYGDEGLEAINAVRTKVMDLLEGFEAICKNAKNVRDFVEKYYDFLVDKAEIAKKTEEVIKAQEEQGFMDLAEETAQVWNKTAGLFDQIVELGGEKKFSAEEFSEMLVTGLSALEIGVLPPSLDDLIMGTMQRTRRGPVKAVLVLGANEGVMPSQAKDEGLFSIEELEKLAAAGTELCKVDSVRVMEESIAIYRNLSKPSEYLWVSYAASNEAGEELRPSEIAESLREIFPCMEEHQDIENSGNTEAMIGGRLYTLRNLTKQLRLAKQGAAMDGIWGPVINWYEENDRRALERIRKGVAFTNEQKNLAAGLAGRLFAGRGADGGDIVLSPSKLEKFSRCPFSHFVAYGLKPEERRIFEASGREIGDVYHKCLMELAQKMTDEDSWDTITEEECRAFISEFVKREAEGYRDGVFSFGNEEKYKTRRLEEICFYVCQAMIEQVRSGAIIGNGFEVPFGRGSKLDAIEIDTGKGRIYIEGKIDRVDILEGGRVKIIDYKTGHEELKEKEVQSGYSLQLMLYLKAAKGQERQPAGVFYFLIRDPMIDVTKESSDKVADKISKEMVKFFRLNGIMVNDAEVIRGIAGDFTGYSDIIPVKRLKDDDENGNPVFKGTTERVLLEEEDFRNLERAVDLQINNLCSQLADGVLSIHPKRTDKKSPCTFCQYKGICRFDLGFDGCSYEIIR